MLEYIYAYFKPNPNESAAPVKANHHFLSRLSFTYGRSIDCPSVRFGMLAFAGAVQFFNGLCENDDLIKEYSSRGHRALVKRMASHFDVAELFTILLLILAEAYRYFSYSEPCQPDSAKSGSREKIGIHLRGMRYLLQQSGIDLRDRTTDGFGGEIWEFTVDSFGSFIEHADESDVVQMASLYYRLVEEFLRIINRISRLCDALHASRLNEDCYPRMHGQGRKRSSWCFGLGDVPVLVQL